MDSFFYDVFLRRWPVTLVALAGIVFSIIRWKRHPKVSALTVVGLVFSQLQSLTFSYLYYSLPRLATRGWSWASIDSLSIAIDICHDIFFSIAIALLAVAVFMGRKSKELVFPTERVTPI